MPGQALYEVRVGDRVVGPVSLAQVKHGRAKGKIPASAEARAVGPWMPVEQAIRPGGAVSEVALQSASFEVRNDDRVVGPVSFYQLRRGLSAGRIPLTSEGRWVGPWEPVEGVLVALGDSEPAASPRRSGRPKKARKAAPRAAEADEDDEGPTLHRPDRAEPPPQPLAPPAAAPPQSFGPPPPQPYPIEDPLTPPTPPGAKAPPALASSPIPLFPEPRSPFAQTAPTRPAIIISEPPPEPLLATPESQPMPLTVSQSAVATARVRPVPRGSAELDELAFPLGRYSRSRLLAIGGLCVAVLLGTGFGVTRCVLVRSAPQRAQNLFVKAESTPDAATAIHLYAQSILARGEFEEPAPEMVAEPKARIAARAQKELDELVAAGRLESAKIFVNQIRPDLHAVGLEQALMGLDQTLAKASR